MDAHISTDDNGNTQNTKRRRSQESPSKISGEVEQRGILSSPCSSAQSTSSEDPPSSPDGSPDTKPPQPKVLPMKVRSPKVSSPKVLPPKVSSPKVLPLQVSSSEVPIPKVLQSPISSEVPIPELPSQVASSVVLIPEVFSPKVPTQKVTSPIKMPPNVASLEEVVPTKATKPKNMLFIMQSVRRPSHPSQPHRRLPGSVISEIILRMKAKIILAKELMKIANIENTQEAKEELATCIQEIIAANDSLGPFKLREIEDMKVLLENQQGPPQQDDS